MVKRYKYSDLERQAIALSLTDVLYKRKTLLRAINDLGGVSDTIKDSGVYRNFSEYVEHLKKRVAGLNGSHLTASLSYCKTVYTHLSNKDRRGFIRSIEHQIEYDSKYGVRSISLSAWVKIQKKLMGADDGA